MGCIWLITKGLRIKLYTKGLIKRRCEVYQMQKALTLLHHDARRKAPGQRGGGYMRHPPIPEVGGQGAHTGKA